VPPAPVCCGAPCCDGICCPATSRCCAGECVPLTQGCPCEVDADCGTSFCQGLFFNAFVCNNGQCQQLIDICNDFDPCTLDSCDVGNGGCVFSPLPNGTSCEINRICCNGLCAECCGTNIDNCNVLDPSRDLECIFCDDPNGTCESVALNTPCTVDGTGATGCCNGGLCVACPTQSLNSQSTTVETIEEEPPVEIIEEPVVSCLENLAACSANSECCSGCCLDSTGRCVRARLCEIMGDTA
jgi:Dictyostelium (slime mold) repeat